MTNVIPFPPSGRADSSARARIDNVRADQIRAAVNKTPFLPADQKRVAENLHRLLEDYQKLKHVRKVDVARKANLGDLLDSTKRLDTYTLPPGAERQKRLAKKPRRYIDISDALATLADETKDAMLCKVFEGCSFGTDRPFEYDWQVQPWERLALLLGDLSAYVIRTTHMQDYWREISQRPGRFDVRTSSFEVGLAPIDGGFTTLIRNPICSDEIPPVPSVPMVRSLQTSPVDGSVSVEGSEWSPARFLFWRETRLAIGPIRTGIGPLLETRTVLEASSEKYGNVSFDNPFTDGSDTIERGLIEETWRPVSIRVDGQVEAVGRQGVEHSYFIWDEVSAASLRAALTLGPHDIGLEIDCYVDRDDCAMHERPASPFLPSDPAFFLYSSIISGSLERDLSQACRSLATKLAAHKESMGELIRQGEIAAKLRWSLNTDSNSSPN
ncbi:hypothetical protein [Agrobacterium pusense]|uniref:hypothetical protein n=1 Tax=Agrobacterium pusense TaxID=648995 RepID=UPI000D1B053C|nr:hypothetical protein [Agrobacterium pusense]